MAADPDYLYVSLKSAGHDGLLKGAGKGAVLGMSAGSVIPGLGNAAGAILGAIAGGLGLAANAAGPTAPGNPLRPPSAPAWAHASTADAVKLNEETLALRKGKLGPDHPDTISTMANLANSYYAVGRHADAVKLGEEALAIRKTKLGPNHPDTLISMLNLANYYFALGRYADALKLQEETLVIRKAV